MRRSPSPRQLGLPLALPPPVDRLEDRGHGTYETPGQRRLRLARERAAHERRKAGDAASAHLANVHLRRMPG